MLPEEHASSKKACQPASQDRCTLPLAARIDGSKAPRESLLGTAGQRDRLNRDHAWHETERARLADIAHHIDRLPFEDGDVDIGQAARLLLESRRDVLPYIGNRPTCDRDAADPR